MTGAHTNNVTQEPLPVFDDAGLQRILAELWDIRGAALRRLEGERDLNVAVGDDLVLKISNPAESRDVVLMENAAMIHLEGSEALTVATPRLRAGREAQEAFDVIDANGRSCIARVITIVPGSPLEGRAIDVRVARRVGEVCAQAALAMAGFFDPAGGRGIDWDPRRAAAVVARAPWTPPPGLPDRLGRIPRAVRFLPGGLLHADVTLTNILVDDRNIPTGLIDLGDMHHTSFAADLAISLTSVLRNSGPRSDAGTLALMEAVLVGYQRFRPLSVEECAALGELVIGRLAVTLALSAERVAREGEERHSVTRYDRATHRVLDELLGLAPEELAGTILRFAGLSRDAATSSAGSSWAPDLVARRRAAFGGTISPLFYDEPLSLTRGAGSWLFDASGRAYLDAYNNVAVVGHAHPTVVRAVTAQLGVLNTHSRYVHPGAITLAERLVSSLPEELDSCLFTTSGTEANELAWRVATACTGGDGAIIVEHAYHGATRWMADLSSNEWPAGHRPGNVATIPAPRGLDEQDGYAEARRRVRDAAAALNARGHRAALVLVDPLFTSEGVLDAPASFFHGLLDGAHDAGALFLADEVQSGYGRTGPRLWRHSLAGVTPDLVTMGKPMGAGYPMGGMITRAGLLGELGKDYEYFSTFAATPVAAAAGHAVLDVLEDEDIPASAVVVGESLRAGLRDLARTAPDVIGDVRGVGLIAGADLFPGLPAAAARTGAVRFLNVLVAQESILAGLTGPQGTVLKVRPPLVWGEPEVSRALEGIANAIRSLPPELRG